MSWVAAAVVGSSLVGGLIQGNAAENAAGQAAGAANNATNSQMQMFNTTNAQSAPWRQSGQNALNLIGVGFGTSPANGLTSSDLSTIASNPGMQQFYSNTGTNPGQWLNAANQQLSSGGYGNDRTSQLGTIQSELGNYGIGDVTSPLANAPATTNQGGIDQGQFTHQFNASDLQSNLAPNYQWQLGQGLGALQNSQAGTSGLVSGNAMRGLNDYAQNFAGNAYQNAFNNYNTQQANIFNRLSTIAGLGSASANNSANVGAQTGAGVANSTIAGGQAQAAGTIGMGNAISGGLNNAAGSWYGLKMLQNGSNPIGTPSYGSGGTEDPLSQYGF